ncbi:hypothetical protein SD71_00245 [Cohnella kolymensis]|uniref:ABC transmembrane type-1 domain-containing protein n=2 Tax=Cohnella kolymensis TaxID=1590652 RepID=A0ABR5A8R2_9BACL|nr:hypothetical protein SD71_00245 [Cohnella kolymensis]
MSKKTTHFLFTLPGVLVFAVLFLGPMFTGIYYSMTNWDGLSKKYNFIWFENYIQTFSDVRFMGDIRFTLSYTFLLTFFVTVLSLLLAVALNSRLIRFRNAYRSAFFFPAVLGSIVVGLIWNQIFYGVIPNIGKFLGINALSTNPLGNPNLALYGILFVSIWQGIAIPMVLFIAGLQSVPQHLYEAATLDGATIFQKFRDITFPFLVPVLSVVLVLKIRAGLTTFEYIMAMTGGGPGFSTESIGLLIFKQGFGNNRFGLGAAQSVLLLVAIALFSILQFSYLNRKGVDQQ